MNKSDLKHGDRIRTENGAYGIYLRSGLSWMGVFHRHFIRGTRYPWNDNYHKSGAWWTEMCNYDADLTNPYLKGLDIVEVKRKGKVIFTR